MKSKIRFGTWEIVTLVFNIICMQNFLSYPRIMSESAGSAGWILATYVSAIIFIIYAIIVKFYKKFNGMDIVDIGEYIGGTPIRVMVGSMYFIYMMFALILTLREFSENMNIIALPSSPISFIITIFCIVMIVACYIGIESIVRFSVFIIPIIFVGYIIILIAIVPYYNINNLLPILGTGPNQIFFKGLSRLSIYAGLSAILFLQPYVGNYKIFIKSGYLSLLISMVTLILGCLCYQLLIPYPGSTQSFLPIYSLTRQIYFGRFFQRIEAFFIFMWAGAGMLYISAIMYISLEIFRKSFKLEYIRPIIVPMTIVSFTLSLLPESLMTILKLESSIFRSYSWIMVSVFPILLLLIAGLKKRIKEEANKK